ncbi:hypothetical protein NIES1031_12105 [Chroogloeocystis siderophila 5.2 s.c.1]|jgi:hypothetical protein|uniref:Uncharacterized protein n=1 Tax=Chroogloeocystis siderophila 5.2 s.c.1 TaxID=247279 RepID=A0A1U7HQA8_9CHRO|nr:hypothetical protein NIES1031_12105 [Chroogloeocystis siderophila 5.2 s.c.1]
MEDRFAVFLEITPDTACCEIVMVIGLSQISSRVNELVAQLQIVLNVFHKICIDPAPLKTRVFS